MSERMLILWTLCGTLALATLGIIVLMAMGINVKIEATLAVAAGWYKLIDYLREQSRGRAQ